MTKRYVPMFRTPRTIPTGRVVIHNHVKPEGFPNVVNGYAGFRVWTDVRKPKDYRVEVCRCEWAPHLRRHFRVIRSAPKPVNQQRNTRPR